jgi:UrcA family protein
MSRFLIASAAALAAFATLTSAEPLVRRDMQVSYADLDLRTERGAAIMLQRIERAAEKVCSHSPAWINPDVPRVGAVLKEIRSCQQQAVASTVVALHANKVTLAYNARYGATRLSAR